MFFDQGAGKMSLDGINFVAVLAAGIIYMIVGALWYSPLLFGNLWLRLQGMTRDQMTGGASVDYLYTFLSALIAALLLSMIVKVTAGNTLLNGALTGALVSLGLGATATLPYSVFGGPKKSVWLLYSAYHLVAFVLMGALIGVWA
jgi:hypothetical protein